MKKILTKSLLITLVFFSLAKNINAASQDEQLKALIETAEAYYRQGEQLQYDSYRKNLNSTPEDATSQHYTYTVCSGFTYQVYKQALGMDIPDTTEELINYAKANKEDKNTVIALYEGSSNIYSSSILGTKDKSNHKKLVKSWIDILKPGDILVVTGHAMMIESIDKENGKIRIIESANGTRYDYTNHVEKYDSEGTIKYTNLEDRMYIYYNYINRDKTLIEDIAILRFVTNGTSYIKQDGSISSYKITPSAQTRLQYDNIDIEKTVTVESSDEKFNQSVLTNLEEFITYSIKITNNSGSNYNDITIEEILDSKVSIIDNGGATVSSNKLKWTIKSMLPGTSIKKIYKVQVKNNKSNLGKIIVSTGKLNNIATSRIETLIGNRLDKTEKTKLQTAFNNNKSTSQTEKEFINKVYKDAFSIDIGLNNKLTNFDIIGYDSNIKTGGNDVLSVKSTKFKNANIKKYVYNNFYGLEIGEKNVSKNNVVRAILQWNIYTVNELNDRARTITKDMLYDGDIILVNAYDSSNNMTNKSYIYIGGVFYRKIGTNKFEVVSGAKITDFLRNMVGLNYMILRPSIVLDEEIENQNKPEPTPEPEPTPNPKPTPTPKPEPEPEPEPEKPEEPPVQEPDVPPIVETPEVEEPIEDIPKDESQVEEDDTYEEEQNNLPTEEEIKMEINIMNLVLTAIFSLTIGVILYMFYNKKIKRY